MWHRAGPVHLLPTLAPGAEVLCVDLAPGMLERARERAQRMACSGLRFVEASAADLTSLVKPGSLDLVVLPLGLAVIPDHEAIFAAAFSRLRLGGQCLLFDCWAEERGFATWQVELVAQAELSRKTFEPLLKAAPDGVLHWV